MQMDDEDWDENKEIGATLNIDRDLSSDEAQKGLLRESLNCAKFRVIVKRHKHMSYLDDEAPTRSIKGKVVRYDIYNII